MEQYLSVSFSGETSGVNKWLHLEQEYKKNELDKVNLSNIYNMLGYASTGKSSLRTAKQICSYVTIVGKTKIIVDLDFFVWPSDLNLVYTLKSDIGTISKPTVLNLERSFDVIFDNSSKETIPYVFEGELKPQMPFITPSGERIPDLEPDLEDSVVTFDQNICCVLRAKGVVKGHRYTMSMELDKTEDYKIENLQNTIVATWKDDNGKDISESLTLDIPGCVEALLAMCPGDVLSGSKSCIDESCGNEPVFAVYYNTCDGLPVLKRWEKNE